VILCRSRTERWICEGARSDIFAVVHRDERRPRRGRSRGCHCRRLRHFRDRSGHLPLKHVSRRCAPVPGERHAPKQRPKACLPKVGSGFGWKTCAKTKT
jgi:hypothetical protein